MLEIDGVYELATVSDKWEKPMKAYKTLPAKDKKTLKTLLEKKKKTRQDLVKLKNLIESSGAAIYCLKEIRSLYIKSQRLMQSLSMSKKYKEELYSFTEKALLKLDSLSIS